MVWYILEKRPIGSLSVRTVPVGKMGTVQDLCCFGHETTTLDFLKGVRIRS